MAYQTIVKANGERVRFSKQKVVTSLRRSGASAALASSIANQVANEITTNTTTDDIYVHAYRLLKEAGIESTAARYSLKRAIHALGPTGFPFEQFVARLFGYQGMHTETGVIVKGACISHEIDVLATQGTLVRYIECKFHNDVTYTADVKIPLYIHSRFRDITAYYEQIGDVSQQREAWIITNTRFSDDAKQYAKCNGIQLLSWAYPKGQGLEHIVESLGIYPISLLTTLSERERIALIDVGIMLCLELLEQEHILSDIGIPHNRHRTIMDEALMVHSIQSTRM